MLLSKIESNSCGAGVNLSNNQMQNERYFEISKIRILKERKMSYSIFVISIFILFLYLFKLFEQRKSLIIHKI